jgi:DNA-nicking Smr family endonuclease
MNFGEMLDEWEKRSAKPGGLDAANEAERRAREAEAAGREAAARKASQEASRRKSEASRISLESWLSTHKVPDKDRGEDDSGIGNDFDARDREARRLADLRPGARLDLHGKTVVEAELALGIFLEDAARRGIEKVLVITGKGNHSVDGPVLGKAMRKFLERSPRAGRFGQATKADGGSGALWVLVKKGIISRGR